MLDQLAILLTLLILWIGGRFIARRWLWHSVARRRLTMRQAVLLNAASFAIIPLLALAFAPSAWLVLLAASITIFVFELLMSRLAMSFDKSNPPPT